MNVKYAGPRTVPHDLDFDTIALRCKVPSHAAGTSSAKANLTGRSHWSECNCHAILGESERSSVKKAWWDLSGHGFCVAHPVYQNHCLGLRRADCRILKPFHPICVFFFSPYELGIPFDCDNKSIILAIM